MYKIVIITTALVLALLAGCKSKHTVPFYIMQNARCGDYYVAVSTIMQQVAHDIYDI